MRRSMARKGMAKEARLKLCMNVCMYVWVGGYVWVGEGIGLDLLCDGISDASICPAGVLASRPDMWREADTAGRCRWSAGISNLLAIHSAEEVIAITTTCKVPHCLEIKDQVRSATRPASLHIHLRISSDVYKPYKVLHTYIHTYIHTVHIVYSLDLTICKIRRELAVRQQQMDDTVGGEGTWIGNITAPDQRRARGFHTEGRWLLIYLHSPNIVSACGTTTCCNNGELLKTDSNIAFI